MRVRGKLKGREITLDKETGIPSEVEIEVEISFPKEEVEVFGIWKDRDDIKRSIDWVRELREKEWQR